MPPKSALLKIMCSEKSNYCPTKIARYRLTNENIHLLSDYSCGNTVIDRFFKEEAVDSCSHSTHIFVDPDTDTVVAAVSLACSSLLVLYDENTACDSAPSVEITYFALDSRFHGIPAPESLGEGNISDCIMALVFQLIYEFTESTCAAEYVLLYSTPPAVHFYERNCFVRVDTSRYWRKSSVYLDKCTFMYQSL